MFKKLFLSLFASAMLVLCVTPVTHAAENVANKVANEAPDVLVKRISQEVLEAAKKDTDIQSGNEQKILDLVKVKILPYVDFDRMTQLAAGINWRKATPEQQKALVTQFRILLIYTYAGALAQVKDQRVEYKPFRASPGDTEVEVRSQVVSSRGEPIQLNYRLAKEKNGWKIYDINVHGAWLVETYKGSFRAEIEKSDMDGLIDVLTKKNSKLATTFAKKKSP